ncbi:MAG: hypothetical protein JO184_11325 [Gammaproteobacteria bacterium]|nr:hypothetical protein [Gammaproteobacteria bacterium]MBV8405695.1 hypothetical protein [Gammaproteobacteria bacterium]
MIKRAFIPLLMTFLAGVAFADTHAAATSWVQTLTQQALDSGFLSRLPPNISLVFGLAKPQEGTDVRQLLSKEGHRVRTFNVSLANHADVVIFNVNAQTGANVAYLIGSDGQLRKAVAYAPGGQAEDLPAADAKSGLAREKKYWSARAKAAPGAAAPAAPAAQAPPGH